MQFVVLRENLIKALSIIGRSISLRPQLPVLANISLQALSNQLILSATNLEIGVKHTTSAKVEKEGNVVVPGKLLIEFISSLSANKFEFLLEGLTLQVRTDTTKASFTTMDSADFPPFPSTSSDKKKLPFLTLKDSFMRAIFAASTDETRPVLTGVRLVVIKGKLKVAATDGYRMSMEEVNVPSSVDDLSLILPAASLSEVLRIASEVKAEEIGFSVIKSKNQVVFSLPQTEVFTRLIDGEFPNIEKIIPQSFKTKVTIEKEELAKAVKTASLFARGAANIIKIQIVKDGLKLSANAPQIGTDEELVEAKVEGEETEIAFNFRFLLEVLNNFPTPQVVFEMSGSLSPGVFKPSSPTPNFLHIIMPVRIQG